MSEITRMDPEMLTMVLDTINKLEKEKITLEAKLEMDKEGEFPKELINFMLSPEVALHLIFIPAEYGGLGAGAMDIAIVSERLAKMDLAIATSFLAICLGTDPIRVGSSPEQKAKYIGRIAEEGLIVAYGVTEPEAGSNVQALKTKAERVLDEKGEIKGYKLNGQKQFITNGGVAQIYTILAEAPDGPTFFIAEAGDKGLIPGKHEDKHGIRASDTCPLTLEDLYIPKENLIGGVEGQGLKLSNEVFGYTRLMVATFGLGGGMAALEKTIAYAKDRVQFGSPLIEIEGYTHRLLVPNAVRLEAARAYIEEVATRLDTDEKDLQVEGSIAKYFATEAGDAMANDAIQGLGGYGYIKEYEVEKIKRDVKICCIYEGTSEIQRRLISMFRLQATVRSKGEFYKNMADKVSTLSEDTGGLALANAINITNDVILAARKNKLTKSQYVMFLLADMMTWTEVAKALCIKAANYAGKEKSPEYIKAAARLFVREAVEKVYINGLKICQGCETPVDELSEKLSAMNMASVMKNILKDMDIVAEEIKK
ncbi:MAG: acyl-CoA dehydrogenase family protein [Deltaproteobacteria bacterium]|nr:acyl-CoA dehydrogenase family protein [Deltaproteobacteria bacterium]